MSDSVAVSKKKVSKKEFDKQVEVEAAHLIYMHGMGKEKADKTAAVVIDGLFEVVNK